MFQLFHRERSRSQDQSFVVLGRDGRITMDINSADLFGKQFLSSNNKETQQNEENEKTEFIYNLDQYDDDDDDDDENHNICYCDGCRGPRHSSQGKLEMSCEEDNMSLIQLEAKETSSTSEPSKALSSFDRRWFSLNDITSGAHQRKLLELAISSVSGEWKVVEQRETWLTPFYRFFGLVADAPRLSAFTIAMEKLTEWRWIGSGAQALVYVAMYRGEEVAVKKLRHACSTEAIYLERLHHKNIVQLYGLADENCLVMEYCRFGPLFSHLQSLRDSSSQCLSPTQFVNWAEQIASGMAYLHRHGIIHRDLKSPNILIADKYQLKISDFGISRQMLSDEAGKACNNQKMSFAGTISWMAPEALRNEQCSEKIDVWSYGVVVWELITLEQPYRNMPHAVILYRVATNRLDLPLSNLPPTVRKLLKLCFKRNACQRPSFESIKTILRCHVNSELGIIDPNRYIDLQKQWRFVISQQLDKSAGLSAKIVFS